MKRYMIFLSCVGINFCSTALEKSLEQFAHALVRLKQTMQSPTLKKTETETPVFTQKPDVSNPVVVTKTPPSTEQQKSPAPTFPPPLFPVVSTAPGTKVPTIDQTARTVSQWHDYFAQDPKRVIVIKDRSEVWQTIFHVDGGLQVYTGSPSAATIVQALKTGEENAKRMQRGEPIDVNLIPLTVDIAWEIYTKYQPYITNTPEFAAIISRSQTVDFVAIKKAIDAWGTDAYLVIASYQSPWALEKQTGVSNAAIEYFNKKFGANAYESLLNQKLGY